MGKAAIVLIPISYPCFIALKEAFQMVYPVRSRQSHLRLADNNRHTKTKHPAKGLIVETSKSRVLRGKSCTDAVHDFAPKVAARFSYLFVEEICLEILCK